MEMRKWTRGEGKRKVDIFDIEDEERHFFWMDFFAYNFQSTLLSLLLCSICIISITSIVLLLIQSRNHLTR